MSQQSVMFGNLFHSTTEQRLEAIEPQNAKSTVLETMESMEIPRVFKIENPPIQFDGHSVDTGLYSLVRDSYKGKNPKFFNTVGKDYELIEAYEIAEMLDGLDGFKPDNVGFHRSGKEMIVSMKLDEVQIKSSVLSQFEDKISNARDSFGYEDNDGGVNISFFIHNPQDGSKKIRGGLKATVKVCANGLVMPFGIEMFSITHHIGAKEHLNDWIYHVWENSIDGVSAYSQALQHLTTIPIKIDNVKWIANSVYPQNEIMSEEKWYSQPRRGRKPFEKYEKELLRTNNKNQQKANALENLILGQGRGINPDSPVSGWDVIMGMSEQITYGFGRKESDLVAVRQYQEDNISMMESVYNMVVGLQ